MQESEAVVAISSPERAQEAAELMPSLQGAARATLEEFPVPGVRRMVVTLAEGDQVEQLFGESEGSYDYAGFATETQAAPRVQSGKVGDPRDPDAVTGRIVLDIDYALEDLDYFGDIKGGSPLLRHEALHLSMLLGDLDRWGPEWAVEGAATWWEGVADTVVREDLLAWAETLAEEEDHEAAWPPSDPEDFYPQDSELIDRHYVDAGLVFVFIEERYGQDAASGVVTGCTGCAASPVRPRSIRCWRSSWGFARRSCGPCGRSGCRTCRSRLALVLPRVRDSAGMRISAKADYAVRAALELAGPPARLRRAEEVAGAQDIPLRFLETVLTDLRRAGIVASQRGVHGGHRLARDPGQVTLADVVRAVDGPLVFVNGERPSDLTYCGTAEVLLPVWVAVRSAVRQVLEGVTLADVIAQQLPAEVEALTSAPGAWDNDPTPAQPRKG